MATTDKTGVSIRDFEAGIFELDGASEFKNFLIYGDSGVGKTVLSGMLPGKIFFLAGEPGYISAARLGARGKGRIIPDTGTMTAGLMFLESGRAKDYDWIVLDGLSTMNNKFLLQYTAEAHDARPGSRAGRNLPDKPDYLNTQNFTKSAVAQLVDLPANVLITAHAMRPEGDDGETLVYPGIQGKGIEVSNFVAGMMHVVGYMKTVAVKNKKGERQERRILFRHWVDSENDTRYFAKDQFNALPRVATIRDDENPDGYTMADLVAMCDKKSTKDTKKKGKGKNAQG